MQWPDRLSVRPIEFLPALAAHVHKPCLSQHTQVLRHRRLVQIQRFHDVPNRPLPSRQKAKNLPAPRLCNRIEDIRCGSSSCHIQDHIFPYEYVSSGNDAKNPRFRNSSLHPRVAPLLPHAPDDTIAEVGFLGTSKLQTLVRA